MRVTQWYDDGEVKGISAKEYPCENSMQTIYQKYGDQDDYSDCDEGYYAMETLKGYEDKLENGRMMEVPCIKGDILYLIVDGKPKAVKVIMTWPFGCVFQNQICNMLLEADGRYYYRAFEDIGYTVFVSEDEASAKCK